MESLKYFHLFNLLSCPLLDAPVNTAKAENKVSVMYFKAQKDKLLWLNKRVLSRAWAQETGEILILVPIVVRTEKII